MAQSVHQTRCEMQPLALLLHLQHQPAGGWRGGVQLWFTRRFCVLAFCQASLNKYRIVSYWCAVCSGVCGLQLHVHTHHPHRPPYRRIFYVTQFIWWLRCTKTRRIWLWTFIDVCSRVHVQLRGNIAQMWIQGFILAEGYEVGCRKGNLIPSKYVGLGLYTMFRKKVVRLIFGHNLCECWPIFKILSLTYSQETPMFFS